MVATISAQTTPVPILKQINTVNDDGSYTYGFEAADGTFKIETRDVNGNVKGKYGYVDANGDLKTVEYSAGKPGFEAKGDHLPEQPTPALPEGPQDDEEVPVRPVPARLPARTQPAVSQQPASTGALATPSVQLPALNQVQFAPQQQFAPQPHQLNQLPFAPMPTFNQQAVQSPQFNDVNAPRRGFSFSFDAPLFAPQPQPQPQQFTNFNPFPQQPFAFNGFRAF